jgi:TetR/AcrR family transcriptional regulator, lmrAB and yxaGH operons repressor
MWYAHGMARTKTAQSTVEPQLATRDRLVEAALSLFRRHGYSATGVKAVLAAAKAPYGSLYHWFPGGKQQLGVAAVAHGGEGYRALIASQFPSGVDVVAATQATFEAAAIMLEETDFADACPIATIALEVASSDEPMRIAAATAFESWLALIEERLVEAGMAATRAREVAVEVFCMVEGAALLARTTRSTEPLRIAGRAATDAVATGLAEARH